MISIEQINTARKNWLKASNELRFEIETPYTIVVNSISIEVFAFLPGYGSPNGVIIELMADPEYKMDKKIIEWAKENNCFWSFIDIESLLNYNIEYIKEILEDWRKF